LTVKKYDSSNVTQLRQPTFRRRQDTNQRRIHDWTDGNQISS